MEPASPSVHREVLSCSKPPQRVTWEVSSVQQRTIPKIDLVQWPRWGSPKGRGRGHWVLCCRRPRSPPAAQLLNALLVASAPPGALVLGRPARAPQSAARALRPAPGEGPVPGSHEGGNPPAPPPAGPPARSARKNGLERWAWDSVAPSRTPGLGTRRLHRLHRGERRELTSPLSGRHQLFLGPE